MKSSAVIRYKAHKPLKSQHDCRICYADMRHNADFPCRVILLDHHKTAIEAFQELKERPDNLESHLELQLSGATIALKHFRPKVFPSQSWNSVTNLVLDSITFGNPAAYDKERDTGMI